MRDFDLLLQEAFLGEDQTANIGNASMAFHLSKMDFQ